MTIYTRPLPASVLQHVCQKKAAGGPTTPATEKQVKLVSDMLREAVYNERDAEGRFTSPETLGNNMIAVLQFLWGADVFDASQLTRGQASAMIAWLKAADGWGLHEHARAEAANVIEAVK